MKTITSGACLALAAALALATGGPAKAADAQTTNPASLNPPPAPAASTAATGAAPTARTAASRPAPAPAVRPAAYVYPAYPPPPVVYGPAWYRPWPAVWAYGPRPYWAYGPYWRWRPAYWWW